MAADVQKTIWSLDTAQVIAACQSLVTLLDQHLQEQQVKPPEGADVSDLEGLVSAAEVSEQAFYNDFASANFSSEEEAEAARSMLLLVADLGFEEQVGIACQEAQESRDLGVISGPLILAGLAIVLAWMPKEQRTKVHKIHYKLPNGTEYTEDVSESETIRVGAAAVAKLSGWWKAMISG